jgi:hypothetical protein
MPSSEMRRRMTLVKSWRYGGNYILHFQGDKNQKVDSFHPDDRGDTFAPTRRLLQKPNGVHIPEDSNLHSQRRGTLRFYIALTGWGLQHRCNVFPVRYELGFYIPEDDILHSQNHGNLRSYIALTGWGLQRRCNVFPVRYELGFYIPEDDILHSQSHGNLRSYIIVHAFLK